MLTNLLALHAVAQSNDYLARNTHEISLSGKNFSEIGKAIGDARIVQLGEQTHGDGTTFEFKVEMIKYLHQKKGFSVLVWESGLADCRDLTEGLASKRPLNEVADGSVFGHWSRSKEAFEIFEYARKTASQKYPLKMDGFDVQTSGRVGMSYVGEIGDELKRHIKTTFNQPLFDSLEKIQQTEDFAQRESEFRAISGQLLDCLSANEEHLVLKLGAKKVREYRQLLFSASQYKLVIDSFLRYQNSQTMEEFAYGYNIREKANANNVDYLLHAKYPDEKIIIWAHNAHVCHGGSAGNYDAKNPESYMLDSTGRLIKERYQDKLYSIGFVARSGSWSWLGQEPTQFVEAEKGSLEDLIARKRYSFAFTDLRRARKYPKDKIHRPIVGYLNRQNGSTSELVWPEMFDGLLYIDVMKPRTQMKSGG